jgi:hypothetical protein
VVVVCRYRERSVEEVAFLLSTSVPANTFDA